MLNLPFQMKPPAMLKLDGIPESHPIIHLPNEIMDRPGPLAYYQLSSLLLRKETVVVEEQEPSSIQVSQDVRTGAMVVIDGAYRVYDSYHGGYSHILGYRLYSKTISAKTFHIQDLRLVSPTSRKRNDKLVAKGSPYDVDLEVALSFRPKWKPDFTPLLFVLSRNGKDCPVVIEKVTYREALEFLKRYDTNEIVL